MKSSKKRALSLILAAIIPAMLGLCIVQYINYKEYDGSSPTLMSTSDKDVFAGVRRQQLDIPIDGSLVRIDMAVIDTNQLSIGIGISSPDVAPRDPGAPKYAGLTLSEYAALGNYRIVQSGGFLSSWSPPSPLGYVKIQGQEYNRSHNSWLVQGMFCTDGRKFEFSRFSSEHNYSSWPSCLQAGPLVILGSRIILDTRRNTGFVTKEAHRQSFICENNKGFLLMGIAQDIKLTSLASILVKSEHEGGLSCVNAVALNGKGIAGLLFNFPGGAISIGNTEVPLPNAIVVK